MEYTKICKEKLFMKPEQDGTTLVLIKPAAHQVFLNKTGMHILELAFKFNNTDDLLDQLSRNYPNIDRRVLETDLNELIYILDIYGIISFNNSDTCINLEDNNEMKVKAAGDDSYKVISDFIKSEGLFNNKSHFVTGSPAYYEPIALRYRSFNNKEYGVYATIKGTIYSYMSIMPPVAKESTVLVITSLFFKHDLGNYVINNFITAMINRAIRLILTQNIKKLRLTDIGNTSTDIIEILENIGFKQECVLKNEIITGDMVMYTMII